VPKSPTVINWAFFFSCSGFVANRNPCEGVSDHDGFGWLTRSTISGDDDDDDDGDDGEEKAAGHNASR
jgi:hypothetical protein